MIECSLSLQATNSYECREGYRSIIGISIFECSAITLICRTSLPRCRFLELSPRVANNAFAKTVRVGDVLHGQHFLVPFSPQAPPDLQSQPPISQLLSHLRER